MSNAPNDAHRLNAELAQLRAALHAVEAPALDEADLRARFRDAELRSTQRNRGQKTGRGGGSRRLPLAAAAAVVLAVGGVLTVAALRGERSPPAPLAAEVPGGEPAAIGAFQPLLSSPGLSASAS